MQKTSAIDIHNFEISFVTFIDKSLTHPMNTVSSVHTISSGLFNLSLKKKKYKMCASLKKDVCRLTTI